MARALWEFLRVINDEQRGNAGRRAAKGKARSIRASDERPEPACVYRMGGPRAPAADAAPERSQISYRPRRPHRADGCPRHRCDMKEAAAAGIKRSCER